MKLFIDTSNKKFILAIVNDENSIIDFLMKDTDNDIIKNSISMIKKFVDKNKVNLNDINEYMITIGPGSFTGVKVALNIVRTINLVNPVNKIYTINTFNLIDDKEKRYTAIPFGKNKFYLKDKKRVFKKVKIISEFEKIKKDEVNFGYDNFTKEKLMKKIKNNSFKLLDNLDKVNIEYLRNF